MGEAGVDARLPVSWALFTPFELMKFNVVDRLA
jgi:hypothetical protein